MIRTIKKNGKSIVRDVEVFDVYQGEFLPLNIKSVAFSITYGSETKTLVDQEIQEAENSILNALFKDFKAELRK